MIVYSLQTVTVAIEPDSMVSLKSFSELLNQRQPGLKHDIDLIFNQGGETIYITGVQPEAARAMVAIAKHHSLAITRVDVVAEVQADPDNDQSAHAVIQGFDRSANALNNFYKQNYPRKTILPASNAYGRGVQFGSKTATNSLKAELIDGDAWPTRYRFTWSLRGTDARAAASFLWETDGEAFGEARMWHAITSTLIRKDFLIPAQFDDRLLRSEVKKDGPKKEKFEAATWHEQFMTTQAKWCAEYLKETGRKFDDLLIDFARSVEEIYTSPERNADRNVSVV